MSKHSYTKIEFKNAPDHKTTPLNATNLNHIEGGISDAFTDIRAIEDALAPINLNNGTNDTGSTIKKETYFYVAGAIAKAKTDIANGATLTENTNYTVVTAGGLNDIATKLANCKIVAGHDTKTSSANGDFSFSHNGGFSGDYACIITVQGTSSSFITCSAKNSNSCYCVLHQLTGAPYVSASVTFNYVCVGV